MQDQLETALNLKSAPTVACALHWLLTEHNIFISARPIENWDWWSYEILAKDFISPFYEARVMSLDDEFDTKLDAEINALQFVKDNFNLNPTKP